MVKEKKRVGKKKPSFFIFLLLFLIGSSIALLISAIYLIYQFENSSKDKVYPGVRIDGVAFGGKSPEEVERYFKEKSIPFTRLKFTLLFEDKIATLSGTDLNISFDEKLSSVQAYSIGRSGNFFSDIYQKWQAATSGINLPSNIKVNLEYLDETLNQLAANIDLPAYDALFQFEQGKVMAFKPSKSGRKLNVDKTKQIITSHINSLVKQVNDPPQEIVIELPVDTLIPKVTTENSNSYGIKELLGTGTSKFAGSITGRIHNIELAASRIHGRLIPPGSTFSFNDTLGDVSAATGFQPAYIIKEGRTVLGDGGGVCQVSTTLFRAALKSGLPIVERYPHAYRVSYYEQDSSPGIDATVFSPTHDLKFKNDTSSHILIQAKPDMPNYNLAFEIYGTKDGRIVEMTKPVILSQTPPPPDLFQDDPTLSKGVVKQVDWKAWGAKVTFDYQVVRNGEILTKTTFFSNFKPWQAVFLKGTKE